MVDFAVEVLRGTVIAGMSILIGFWVACGVMEEVYRGMKGGVNQFMVDTVAILGLSLAGGIATTGLLVGVRMIAQAW
jgi:hypothetical protein